MPEDQGDIRNLGTTEFDLLSRGHIFPVSDPRRNEVEGIIIILMIIILVFFVTTTDNRIKPTISIYFFYCC